MTRLKIKNKVQPVSTALMIARLFTIAMPVAWFLFLFGIQSRTTASMENWLKVKEATAISCGPNESAVGQGRWYAKNESRDSSYNTNNNGCSHSQVTGTLVKRLKLPAGKCC